MDNIGMQDSLLSRFDIIFIVLDEVSIIMMRTGMNTQLLFIELRNSIVSYLDTYLTLHLCREINIAVKWLMDKCSVLLAFNRLLYIYTLYNYTFCL